MHVRDDINPEVIAEERLWTAVIARTVEEWVSGPMNSRREAEEYLFGESEDFKHVCRAAGLNPEALQSKLKRLKKATGAGRQPVVPLSFVDH